MSEDETAAVLLVERGGERWECGPHTNAWGGHDARCRRIQDAAPETVGTPFHHDDGRECYARADGSGWWPCRFEDGAFNRSGGTVCFRSHPTAPDQTGGV